MGAAGGLTVPVDVESWIERLAHDGELLAVAIARADLDAQVPTCPDWSVRDLTRHLGMVHRWAATYVAERRTKMWEIDDDGIVGGSWPDDTQLVEWFRTGHRSLVRVLADAEPDLECWTFLPASTPLRMWARRQAHETAIHRVDAELATGRTVTFPPPFARDGIDELLTCFIPRPSKKFVTDERSSLRITTTDADGDWTVSFGPTGATTTTGGAAESTLRGTASDLYLTLWSRRDLDGLQMSGDRRALEFFLDRVHVRWS